MEKYIYINSHSLSKELCEELIINFNKEKDNNNIYNGVTAGGMNKNVKDTNDFAIHLCNTDYWKKITSILYKELEYNTKIYCDKINQSDNTETQFKILLFDQVNFNNTTLQMQRYEANKGHYIYHNDFTCENNNYRVITFLWYINDVPEGGETEFFGNLKIKPETGKLVFFPACWSYPHCGKMPISNDKYIITGWIYNKL